MKTKYKILIAAVIISAAVAAIIISVSYSQYLDRVRAATEGFFK